MASAFIILHARRFCCIYRHACMQAPPCMQVCAYTRMHACGHLPACMHAGIDACMQGARAPAGGSHSGVPDVASMFTHKYSFFVADI